MPASPHILWIVTTQWRAQSCGFAGDCDARTPAIDALAARGVAYTQAVTPHPFGPFARAAMLTGVASPHNGVCDYFDSLPRTARTIAHTLEAHGYSTAWFGKWHLGKRDPAASLVGETHARIVIPPDERGGFTFFEGFESGFLLNDPWLHGTRIPEPHRFPGYQSDVLCERAAAWLVDQASAPSPRPVFSVVSLEAPHPPYAAPASGIALRDPAALTLAPNVPRSGDVETQVRRELAGYHAHIEATDRAIGRLLARVSGDTIVVFTSVHGDMHGAHGHFRKGWPHEESVRVPFVVAGAPGGRAGSRSEDAVSLIDLPAMALAWAESRAWRCERETASISMPGLVQLPHQCDRVWSGVRSAKRKTIFNSDGSPWLIFDLERDPCELENLAPPSKSSVLIAG